MSAPISSSPAAPTLERGQTIGGKYVVERLIGRGGMGAVYLATHEQLGTPVALKVLSRVTELHSARFIREARILASLRSEHVAKVVDFGIVQGTGLPYMVMEFLPGADLSSLLEKATEPLLTADAVDHVLEACEALAEAHRAGIVHRDIKPSNLFVSSRFDGSPMLKVLDFGIAKTAEAEGDRSLTATDMVFGSPAYMSPEQVRSSKFVGTPTDVWSLGLVLYEMVAKKHPFQGDTPASIVASIAADPPAPLADHPLWPLLETVLRKEPAERPSLSQFAAQLGQFAGDRGRIALRRIERLATASMPPLHETVALHGRGIGSSSGSLPSVRAGEVSGTDPTVGVDAEAVAASRTTMGSRLEPRRVPNKVWLTLGAVVVVGIGMGVGLRANATREVVASPANAGSSAASAAAPPSPMSVEDLPLAASVPPAASASAAPAPSTSEAQVGKSTARGGAGKTARPPSSGAGSQGPVAPRQGEFN